MIVGFVDGSGPRPNDHILSFLDNGDVKCPLTRLPLSTALELIKRSDIGPLDNQFEVKKMGGDCRGSIFCLMGFVFPVVTL